MVSRKQTKRNALYAVQFLISVLVVFLLPASLFAQVFPDGKSVDRYGGCNNLGHGGHKTTQELLPHFPGCHPSGSVSTWMRQTIESSDVFSEAWKKQATDAIGRMVRQHRNNPNLIGVYWQDVPAWNLKDSARTRDRTWVDAIRALPEDAAGRIKYEPFLNGAGGENE